MFLPDTMAWYPLPGRQELYIVQGSERLFLTELRTTGLVGTAEVRLSVDGFGSRVYSTLSTAGLPQGQSAGTQHFYEPQAEGVTILSGRFMELQDPGTETALVAGPSNFLEGQAFMKAYGEAVRYFDSWLEAPVRGLHTLFYFPLDDVSSYNSYDLEVVRNRAFYINESQHRNLDSFQLADAVHAAVFGDRSFERIYSDEEMMGNRGVSVLSEIRHAFYLLYYNENPRPPSEEEEQLGEVLYPSFRYRGQGDERIKWQVQEALQKGQHDRVKRVLNHFYTRGLRVSGLDEWDYPVYTYEDWLEAWKQAEEELAKGRGE